MLDKYRGEAPVVRNHLHNLALMEEVFHKLGREDSVRETRESGMSLPEIPGLRGANDMARAHEIIATEHAATLVRELSRR
jgi:hypothetical protein